MFGGFLWLVVGVGWWWFSLVGGGFRPARTFQKLSASPENLLYPGLSGYLNRNGLVTFIVYKIKSDDKPSKTGKGSSPALARGCL